MPECDYSTMSDEELATWATDHLARREMNRREAQRQAEVEQDYQHKYDDLV